MLRMLEIHSGTIRIDDLDIERIPRNTLRARINTVSQDNFIFHGTVRSNLDPENKFLDAELVSALEKVTLWTTLQVCGGLSAQIKDGLLSHGQRQLFCLAIAILRTAQIVLMDEVSGR